MPLTRIGSFFLVALLASGASPLLAGPPQDDPSRQRVLGIADTVIVSGNEKTRAYVILDEMSLKAGSPVTPEAIEYDRNRIYSLGLFTSVDIQYDSLGTTRFLYVEVKERWYVIPVPILGFRDGDPKKPFYGAGLLHYNFRGRNQKLFGAVVLGFDPAVSLSFTDPLFDRDGSLSFGTSFSLGSVRNRSLIESALTGDFDERHFDVSVAVGKRFTIFENAGISFGVHDVKIASYRIGRTASTDGEDLYLYGSLSYNYDSRDLREYAMRGTMVSAYVTKNGFGEADVDFSRMGADVRKYVPITGNVSIAGRLFGDVVSGTVVPTYAREYFGTRERIRGWYTTVREGENLAGGTLELRMMIMEPRTFYVSAIPLPDEFAVWRFGFSLALFTDTGIAWFRSERLTLRSFSTGYGGGVHFLFPYGFVLRTEYAWNERGNGQFIIDLRTSL